MRALLLEDEPFIASMLVEWLEELGHKAIGVVRSNSEALQFIEVSQPDFAFLDVSVPDGLSYPVARALQERQIPFFFTTGYDARSIDPEFAEAPVMTKPFDFERFASLLNSIDTLRSSR
jgi:CheY-like chemotaxis protein